MVPVDVGPHNQTDIYWKPYEGGQAITTSSTSPLAVGDTVRMSKACGAFKRGYKSNWMTELFKVIDILHSERPNVYIVKDYTIKSTRYPDSFNS